jgi:hypothetical protein
MSELNFLTKLIRLTKATVTVLTCCVKIENDYSESFETRQGLRQGDVLSTLLFNVVLEVIVRQADLQTTGTIHNKETQLLAYADDIDIVGRSQSAVRNAYLALEGEAAKVGLKINEKKTKYMIAARTIRRHSEDSSTYRRFVTWDKVWQLATNTLKSSKNLCTQDP